MAEKCLHLVYNALVESMMISRKYSERENLRYLI